jgi:hypothetical protein
MEVTWCQVRRPEGPGAPYVSAVSCRDAIVTTYAPVADGKGINFRQGFKNDFERLKIFLSIYCHTHVYCLMNIWKWDFILIMEAVSSSETSISFYQTTRRNIPEDLQHLKVLFIFELPYKYGFWAWLPWTYSMLFNSLNIYLIENYVTQRYSSIVASDLLEGGGKVWEATVASDVSRGSRQVERSWWC